MVYMELGDFTYSTLDKNKTRQESINKFSCSVFAQIKYEGSYK